MNSAILGTFGIDDISLPGHDLERVVGGAASYASLASSIFAPTLVSGMIGSDFPNDFIEILKSKNVNVDFVQHSKEKSFRWNAYYSDDLNQLTTTYQAMNASKDYDVSKLNFGKMPPKVAFLANLDPSMQSKMIDQLPENTIKLLDSMDLWMIDKRDELREVLKKVDVFFVSEEEAGLLVGKKMPLHYMLDELMSYGPKIIVLKKGRFGLTMYGALGTLSVPSYPMTHVVDPSGAGDSLGGSVAGVLASIGTFNYASMSTALVLGTVVSSFVVEGYTFSPLLNLTLDEVRNRVKMFMDQLPNQVNLLLDRI
ncbi:MAG: PfkB family carbohydrate kinase [bacterium]